MKAMKISHYNFGAGPAMLPGTILKEAQEEFLDWQHQGMSILEIGHRTPDFMALLEHATQTVKELLSIPDHYQILFLGGAARTQFAAIPMNFLHPGEMAGYLITGIWSKMAFEEAQLLKQAYSLANEEQGGFLKVPDPKEWKLKKDTKYVYYTPNETVNGIRFPYVPDTKGLPLIADMTSCLLSEPIDINQYGLIFAGAQKNIANAGLTLVIVRDDLLAKTHSPAIPTMLNYKIQADYQSLYATPPVFNCYLAAKMFDWVKKQGGVEALFTNNCLKAAKLYQYLDASDFYVTKVHPEARSIMNICFSLKNPALDHRFIVEAEQRGLHALQGHRFLGGMRASLYNPMPLSGVEALVEFMSDFAEEHAS